MRTLYEITEDFLSLYDMAEDSDEQTYLDTLESLEFDLVEKSGGYVSVIKCLEADTKAIDDEIKRLTDRKRTLENRTRHLKNHLQNAMETIGIKKIDTDPRFKISIVKNGGVAPLIIDGEVPERFYKILLEVDNSKIREAIKNGENISFAHLGDRGESLRIK